MANLLKRLFGRPAGSGIDDDVWHETLAAMPWLGHLDQAGLARLRELAVDFLSRKTISGAAGFQVDERVRAAIAAQACLPILAMDLSAYDDFVEVIVYPDQFLVKQTRVDEAGVVHESEEALSGEAMDHGPVVISWADAAPGAHRHGWNVTIHEFVHKLDLADGDADGIPPLPRTARARWETVLTAAYEDFCEQLDRVERAIPAHVDPEGPSAEPYYARLPLDPYAATDPAEFFAVSGETFFVAPRRLADAFPCWYRELAAFFAQDPLPARSRGSDDAAGCAAPR